MNKLLERETGEKLFEKRGWKWALTSFGFDIWGETKSISRQENPSSFERMRAR